MDLTKHGHYRVRARQSVKSTSRRRAYGWQAKNAKKSEHDLVTDDWRILALAPGDAPALLGSGLTHAAVIVAQHS